MSHTIIFKTDYGHRLDVLVEEYDEITGLKTPAVLDSYTTRLVIMKKPNGEFVQIPTTTSGIGYLIGTIPSGAFSITGYYQFDVLVENALQRFHSTEFGFNVTVPIEQ